MKRNSIVIDLEWNSITQKIFLFGYAYSLSNYGVLIENKITLYKIKKILQGIENIFVYGPDAGRIESSFIPDLKQRYNVYNVQKAAKHLLPGYKNHKLEHLERYYLKIKRKNNLKSERNNLHNLFKNRKYRQMIIDYNIDDVLNTLRLINKLNKDFHPDWEEFRL